MVLVTHLNSWRRTGESNAVLTALLLWVGERLPQHWGLLLPVVTAILGALHWVVQKQFDELDLPSPALAQLEKAAVAER